MREHNYEAKGAFGATFILEVDGVEIGRFTEVDGLKVTVAVEEIEEGGQNGFKHKLPGRMEWPNLRFKRGVTESNAMFDWFRKSSGEGFAAEGNKLTRATGAITLVGSDGTRLRAWEIEEAFPVDWSGPSFASSSSEMPEEELEVAHHGFRAVNL